MDTRPFGATGARFPAIGFGAWAIGGAEHGNSYGPVDDAESIAAVQTALDLGVEVFDTADAYGHGHSEQVLAQALGDRGAVFTKAGFDFYETGRPRWEPKYLRTAVQRSLQRLGRDRVDLFQLHNPPRAMLEDEATYAFLEELKDEGLARWSGISVHRTEECLSIRDVGGVDAVQVPVSILRQDTLTGIAELAGAGIAVVAREPLANGFLTGKYGPDASFHEADFRAQWPERYKASMANAAKEAIAVLTEHGIEDRVAGAIGFVLAHEVSVVIPGAKTAAHVRANVAAPARAGRLPGACLQDLYTLWDQLQG